MDFMISFPDSVRVGQFAKKNRSESFIQSRFRLPWKSLEFSLEHDLNLLSESLWERPISTDFPNPEH